MLVHVEALDLLAHPVDVDLRWPAARRRGDQTRISKMLRRGSCLLYLGLVLSGAIAGAVAALVSLPWFLKIILMAIVAVIVLGIYGVIVTRIGG